MDKILALVHIPSPRNSEAENLRYFSWQSRRVPTNNNTHSSASERQIHIAILASAIGNHKAAIIR